MINSGNLLLIIRKSYKLCKKIKKANRKSKQAFLCYAAPYWQFPATATAL